MPTLELPPLPPPIRTAATAPPPPPAPGAAVARLRSPQASANPMGLGSGRTAGLSPSTKKAAIVVTLGLAAIVFGGAYVVGTFLGSVKLINNVAEGECLENFFAADDSGYGQVYFVQTTSCDDAHALEVYAVTDSLWLGREPQGTIVDMDELFLDGEEWCAEQFELFVGEPYETSRLGMWTFVPLPQAWEQGDRTVQCLVGEFDEQTLTVGSLRDSAGRSSA